LFFVLGLLLVLGAWRCGGAAPPDPSTHYGQVPSTNDDEEPSTKDDEAPSTKHIEVIEDVSAPAGISPQL
jgi:hypothetical protein